MIYFIRSGQYVKIGLSVKPWERLAALQTAHPETLEMLAIMPGGADEERELHWRFTKSRTGGEWFRETSEMRQYIEQVLVTYPELQDRPPRPTARLEVPPPQIGDEEADWIYSFFHPFVQCGGRIEYRNQPDMLIIGLPGAVWTGINEPDKLFALNYDDGTITPKMGREVKSRTLTDRLNSAAAYMVYYSQAGVFQPDGYGVILRIKKKPPKPPAQEAA